MINAEGRLRKKNSEEGGKLKMKILTIQRQNV